MNALSALSLALVLTLSVTYLFAYRLNRQRFLIFMTLAWTCQVISLSAGLIFPYLFQSPMGWDVFFYALSIISSYSFLIADQHLRKSRSSSIQILLWTLFLASGMMLFQLTSIGALMLFGPSAIFGAFVLIRLSYLVWGYSEVELLSLINPSFSKQYSGDDLVHSHWRNESLSDGAMIPAMKLANLAKLWLFSSLLGLGAVQILELLQFMRLMREILPTLFTITLVFRAIHATGVYTLILAVFSHITGALRLKSLTEELGALASAIEHDLRNPLSNLYKSLAVLEKRAPGNIEFKETISYIENQLRRISASIEIIPTIRESREFLKKRMQEWNLVDIAQSAIKEVKEKFHGQEVHVRLENPSGPIPIQGYRERLILALTNVLINAFEASISCPRSSDPNVKVVCDQKSKSLALISIRDNGPGIPEEILSLIFTPLFSTKLGSNKGIGLYIATRILEQHRGEIVAKSDGESYTEITMTIPTG